MILLDASALIALIAGEPAAPEVQRLLESGECAVTPANLGEVLDRLIRVVGIDSARAREVMNSLVGELMKPLPIDERVGLRAGELRARHYRPRTAELSLADCMLLASPGPRDKIATSDAPLLRAARAEGIEVIPLPDSSGNRPE